MGASREEATVFQSFDDLGRFGLRQACCNCDRASDRSCSIVQSIACDTSTGATDVCVKHAPVLFVWRINGVFRICVNIMIIGTVRPMMAR